MYNNTPFRIIAAMDMNNGIGYDNDLLMNHKLDMANFKAKTMFNIVIMGRNTFESMKCIPLKDRLNIVITRNPKVYETHENLDNLIFVESFERAMFVAEALRHRRKTQYKRDIYVIGGGMLYKEALPYADELIITSFVRTFKNVDTYFPPIPKDLFFITSTRLLDGETTLKTYKRT